MGVKDIFDIFFQFFVMIFYLSFVLWFSIVWIFFMYSSIFHSCRTTRSHTSIKYFFSNILLFVFYRTLIWYQSHC